MRLEPSAPPPFLRRPLETLFRVNQGNRNDGNDSEDVTVSIATGWGMDAAAFGPLLLSGTYVSVAVLELANSGSGNGSGSGDVGSTKLLFGMLQPQALLTVSTTLVGVWTALFMPLIGAAIDITHQKRAAGFVTATLLTFFALVKATCLSPGTWKVVFAVHVLSEAVLLVHLTAALSYLPDLIPNNDARDDGLSRLTTRFNVIQHVSTVGYMSLVVGTATMWQMNSISTAKMSQWIVYVVCDVLFGYSWTWLFPEHHRHHRAITTRARQTSSSQRARDILHASYQRVQSTVRRIFDTTSGSGRGRRRHRLKWFLAALLWTPTPGSGVGISNGITFYSQSLNLTGPEIGCVFLLILVCSVPGAKVSHVVCVRYDALTSLKASLAFWATVNAIAALVLTGPERRYYAFAVAVPIGIALGWLGPTQRVLYCAMMPRPKKSGTSSVEAAAKSFGGTGPMKGDRRRDEREGEFVGMFTFCGEVLGWVPSLAYSVLIQRGYDLRWGYACSDACFLLALLCLQFGVGDLDSAMEEVNSEQWT